MDKSESEEQIDLNKLIKVFRKIRDKRAVNKKEYTSEDDRLSKQQDTLKATLLKYCVTANVNGAKADSGSFTRGTKTRYWTSDWEPMYEVIRSKGVPELLERRISQENMKTYLAENPEETIKGLQTDTQYTITVRKGKDNGDEV